MANLIGIIDLPVAIDLPMLGHMMVQAKTTTGAMVTHWVDAKASV